LIGKNQTDSDIEEIDPHIEDFPGLHSEEKEPKVISPNDAKIGLVESEIPKNLGAQARQSSEARYAQFSDYVIRKISGQVLKFSKKGLWKTEIFLADSPWSRDPENQRRLLAALAKQELAARIFPHHNKKIRILVWWSNEPPIVLEEPFVTKESSNSASHDSDIKGNYQGPRSVVRKRDIALEVDSSSSSASVIETDFKRQRKVARKLKHENQRKARQEKRAIKKLEKQQEKQEKRQRKEDHKQEKQLHKEDHKQEKQLHKQQHKQEKRINKKQHNPESDTLSSFGSDSDSDSDSSLHLEYSPIEERHKKATKKERKAEKKKEKEDRKRIESDDDDDDDDRIGQLKLDDKKRSHGSN